MLQMNRQITGIVSAYSSKDQEKVLTFGKNSLKVYPRSNITFNPLPHIVLDEEQKCIIDNLWISFSQIFNYQTNKNLDRKYFITCLSCLLEYFHKKNNSNVKFSYYVIYQGHKTGIFKTWEEVLPYISNHPRSFFKGFYNLTQALDQCKTNLGSNYFISPLVKQFLNHHGQPYLKPVEPCSSQTTIPDLTHDFPPLFPPFQNQDHLLREELEILRKKYDRSEQDYLIIKNLYEDKIENEIDIKLKNTALERKKFKIEHTNNFEHINNFSVLENQPENINIEPSPIEQFINSLEPSSLGINNEPSPAQTVAGKDTPNPFMGEAFPKSLLVQLTQQVAEILKKDIYKEV